MQSIFNALLGATPTNENGSSQHAPTCPKYLEHLARTTALVYNRFLELVQENLATADDNAMNEMRGLISKLKPLIHNLELIHYNDHSHFPYDSVNSFDFHIISALEILTHQLTSPQSAQMRQSLISMVTMRKKLLNEYTSQGAIVFVCVTACYTHNH